MKRRGNTSLKKKQNWRHILWLVLLWMLAIYLFRGFNSSEIIKMSYTAFKKIVDEGKVSEITVKGNKITGRFKEPVTEESGPKKSEENTIRYKYFETIKPSFEDPELLDLLEKNNVNIKAESQERSWVLTLVVSLLPWILIIGLIVYGSKKSRERIGGMGGGLFGFGRSRAKLYHKSMSDVSFDDVAGLPNAKKELQEVIDFLKDPSKFKALGGKLPKGIILVGAPGTGKTLMARSTAGEADVPFFSISGSEFIEMFVGVGASRVRDMFNTAKKEAPSIIFIDEMDSIGRVRGTGLGGGHDEREQTLNQILAEMDGFSPHESVVVMAATNRPDVLDPALIRPGRFDRQIVLELPQKKARAEILQLWTKDVPLADDVDLGVVARRTVGRLLGKT